jgi:hypothetical protein
MPENTHHVCCSPATRWDGPVGTGSPVGNRRVIHATCSMHGGSRGFTNLAVTRSDGGQGLVKASVRRIK